MKTAPTDSSIETVEVGSCSMKYWEIVADNLKKAGCSLGWVSAVDSQGRTVTL
jgi:hypothetical protein